MRIPEEVVDKADAHAAVRVAIIESKWHGEIVGQAVDAFSQRLTGIMPNTKIDRFRVPGAFEIPLRAQRLVRSGKYAAVAGCGLVIDGGIYRHEFVASAVVSGLMQIQLAEDVPVFSAVLTPHHFHEHASHHDFFSEHMRVKGEELAEAVIATLQVEIGEEAQDDD